MKRAERKGIKARKSPRIRDIETRFWIYVLLIKIMVLAVAGVVLFIVLRSA